MKRFELLRGHPHYALNVARLPVPPHRRMQPLAVLYTMHRAFVKANFGATPHQRCRCGVCVCPLFQGAEEIQDGCGDGEFSIRFVLNVTVDTRLGVVVDELELEAFEDW